MTPGRSLALEVADSCALGDHTTITRPALRGLVGLGALVVGSIFRKPGSPAAPDKRDIVLVSANPVAHGARLVESVRAALLDSVRVVADSRFATVEVQQHFPGVSMASLSREISLAELRAAFALRRKLPRQTVIPGSRSRVYGEYLFIAQAARYSLALKAVAGLPHNSLVLTDFDRAAYSRAWIWAASQAGLPTATLVHGSPNSQNYLPILAESVFAWGEVQAKWLAEVSPDTAVWIVGRPELSAEPISRASPGRAIICHSRETLSEFETAQLHDVLLALRSEDRELTLRLHPSARVDDLDAQWSSIAALCDRVTVGSDSLIENLSADDILLSVASSSVVDAIAMGVRGLVVSDADRSLPVDLEAVRAASASAITTLLSGRASTADTPFADGLGRRLVAERGTRSAELLRKAATAARAPRPGKNKLRPS